MSFPKRLWRRLGKASKTEFALDSINTIALGYQGYISVIIAASKLGKDAVGPIHGALFLAAFAYTFVHRGLLKDLFQKKKWKAESIRRSQAIGVALSQLANNVRTNKFTTTSLHQIEQGLLSAMKSEVESVLGDSEGIYLSVNLIVEDRPSTELLIVLNRSNLDRELYKTYPKDDSMIAWQAMKANGFKYVSNYKQDNGKPYRSILAFPIVSHADGKPQSLGAISIDSSIAGHFDGHENKLETVLLFYISIQKLILTYRQKFNLWRPS
nr:hypothetical protein [Nitrosomonas nitrosa]